jgi:SAM-dependent methyltransferase
MISAMAYDPTLYRGSAPYYARGRAPYSRELGPTLAAALALDGSGRLLDCGCGPGIVAIELAARFSEVVALDPDTEMLAEGARRAADAAAGNIRWVCALAEDLPRLDLGTFRLVTFGQSFQWTDRERVAEAVYDLLEPGGALALIVPDQGLVRPEGLSHPPVPDEAIRALIDRYLGPRRRAGQGFSTRHPDRFEDALSRTRFGRPEIFRCPGRRDIVQDADAVVAGCFSTSYAAPHLFGDRRAAFEGDLRALLADHSRSGLFWNWPGDTEVLLSRKPPR